jgi:hypothetical protein
VIVYDAGALIAGERADRAMWALHEAALRRGVAPVVPAAALAEAWCGGPQVNLARLLAGCAVAALDERVARATGMLCGAAGAADVVDASVVVTARSLNAAIVTGDLDDLRPLLDAAGVSLPIVEGLTARLDQGSRCRPG